MEGYRIHQMNLQDIFGDRLWDQEDTFTKDRNYMKHLFPKHLQRIFEAVEDVCDEQEFDGSCIYDEYPDQNALEQLLDRILRKVDISKKDMWIKELIMSLLYNEVCFRRERRRAFKRHLYSR